MEPEDDWVMVNGVPTRVRTWGGRVTDRDGLVPGNNSIILMISGNPGMTGFYNTFLAEIYTKLAIPVWALSHAGHEYPPKDVQLKTEESNENGTKLYFVNDQIAHKAQFIRQYVPEERHIYIIAHSMGSKITVELLKDTEIRRRISKCYLLFPTLERFKDTPHGKRVHPNVTDRFFGTIIFFSGVFKSFPMGLRSRLIKAFFRMQGRRSVDENIVNTVVQLIQPPTLRNVFKLVRDQVDKIGELDTEVIAECADKLKIYFGVNDGWAPLTYQDSLKEAVPNIDSSTLESHLEHAFFIGNAKEMAQIISDQIKNNLSL